MKHDELLAKMAATPIDLKGTVIMYEALLAVVELHKPDMRGNCDICSWIIGKPGFVYYSACPTIQAVEKEFN